MTFKVGNNDSRGIICLAITGVNIIRMDIIGNDDITNVLLMCGLPRVRAEKVDNIRQVGYGIHGLVVLLVEHK
jgi:hypothetical protein